MQEYLAHEIGVREDVLPFSNTVSIDTSNKAAVGRIYLRFFYLRFFRSRTATLTLPPLLRSMQRVGDRLQ